METRRPGNRRVEVSPVRTLLTSRQIPGHKFSPVISAPPPPLARVRETSKSSWKRCQEQRCIQSSSPLCTDRNLRKEGLTFLPTDPLKVTPVHPGSDWGSPSPCQCSGAVTIPTYTLFLFRKHLSKEVSYHLTDRLLVSPALQSPRQASIHLHLGWAQLWLCCQIKVPHKLVLLQTSSFAVTCIFHFVQLTQWFMLL